MDCLPLVLASRSPRRRWILEQLGFHVEVVPADIREEVRPSEKAEEFALRVAREKAVAVLEQMGPGRVTVAADTVVVLGERILGKPSNTIHAREMLLDLSGKSHRVVSGYSVRRDEEELVGTVVTLVSFRRIEKGEIDSYVATGEPLDKAGAYAIQGRGGILVDRIEGSYTNVVGLPVAEVLEAIQAIGKMRP